MRAFGKVSAEDSQTSIITRMRSMGFESKVKQVSSSVGIEVSQISLFSLKRRLSNNIFLTHITVKRYILGKDPTQLDALRFRI